MDKDLIREKRRRAFISRRRKAYEKVMAKHPEGITKVNLEEFKKAMKKEEKRLKKED